MKDAAAMPVHIYLVEDHPTFRHALSIYLSKLPDLTISGIASSGQEALTQIPKVKPDIVLMDISLPDINGIDVVEELGLGCPDIPILMLSGHKEATYVRQALGVGARGFIVKGNPMEIEPAIRAVLNGEIYLSPELRKLE